MRVLMVHNYYQQAGGEDRIFESEAALLEARGVAVERYVVDNDRIPEIGLARTAARTIWSRPARRDLRAAIAAFRPDVVHFHNTFPLVSPAGYAAANDAGVPVVQNVQNYRLLCLNALFHRDGHVCEDCLGRPIPWPGGLHACYRDSRAGSVTVAAMLSVHRALRTWSRRVDLYLTPTEFLRSKLIEGGIPAEKIVVKPNGVSPDPGLGDHGGGYVLFAGRLTPEKGIPTLLKAWERMADPLPLRIAGDGPLADQVADAVRRHPALSWLGRRSQEELYALMRDAALVVVPSEWYEGAPMVIAEAFACGTPVLGSDIGGIASMVRHGQTGLLFPPGDDRALAEALASVRDEPSRLQALGRNARAEFDARYSPARNFEQLIAAYLRVSGSDTHPSAG